MNPYAKMQRQLQDPDVMQRLQTLYGSREGMLVVQHTRYTRLLKRHEDMIGNEAGTPIYMISAPGRTEIAGNHTDHNRGKVLAAAVNLDTLAAVSHRSDNIVNIHSEGYPALSLSVAPDQLEPRKEEEGTTAALVRGMPWATPRTRAAWPTACTGKVWPSAALMPSSPPTCAPAAA